MCNQGEFTDTSVAVEDFCECGGVLYGEGNPTEECNTSVALGRSTFHAVLMMLMMGHEEIAR